MLTLNSSNNALSPITIVDYGVGNIGSIINMFDFIGVDCSIAKTPEEIRKASRLVLPGVGAFDTAMLALSRQNLIEPLYAAVMIDRRPILGICLGMQLLARKSEEGSKNGLGWIQADVVRLNPPSELDIKIPHIGWSLVQPTRSSVLFPDGNHQVERFYFVHSYAMQCDDAQDVAATVQIGGEVCCAVVHDNIMGVQFHPEKSHRFGMRILRDFVANV